MKRLLIFLYLITFFKFAISQSDIRINKQAKHFINNCADSINYLKFGDSIPTFLYNPCFDYKKLYWNDMHHPIPLRKLIVDKINSIDAIMYILQNSNSSLYEICSRAPNDTLGLTYYTIPYIDKPFGELLKQRLTKLQK